MTYGQNKGDVNHLQTTHAPHFCMQSMANPQNYIPLEKMPSALAQGI